MLRRIVLGTLFLGASVSGVHAASFDAIDYWAGSGTHQAGLVVHWSAPEVFNNTALSAPITDTSRAWGYHFDGSASAEDMMVALAAADSRLYLYAGGQPGLGMAILGIGYDLDDDGVFGLSDGNTTYDATDFTNGTLADQAYGDADVFQPTDDGDLYWGGWYGPNWELWHEQDGNGGFDESPNRGNDTYWSGSFFSGSHGEWDFSGLGISSLSLEEGSWVGWSVAGGGLDMSNPNDPGTLAWMNNKQAPGDPIVTPEPASLALLGLGCLLFLRSRRQTPAPCVAVLACGALMLTLTTSTTEASPFASEVVAYEGPFGASPYDDPNSLLGKPSTGFYDPWGGWSGGTTERVVKMVEPAYNLTVDQSSKLITTLNDDAWAIVKFDQIVENDPLNPYGIDLLVFGNEFFVGTGTAGGFVNDNTDMSQYSLAGGAFYEPVTVSVSPGFQSLPGEDENDWDTWQWYEYTDGPFGDGNFPTHAYQWDQDKFDVTGSGWTDEEMDFTKPVNPALLDTMLAGGTSVADAIDLYDGSGGGAGFDLDESGFDWIQYVKVRGNNNAGEIDAFADVAAIPEPASLALLVCGGLAALKRRN